MLMPIILTRMVEYFLVSSLNHSIKIKVRSSFYKSAVFMSQSKLAELQRDSTSNQHMETLKQKIMKLRKENEVLKRKLADSKES